MRQFLIPGLAAVLILLAVILFFNIKSRYKIQLENTRLGKTLAVQQQEIQHQLALIDSFKSYNDELAKHEQKKAEYFSDMTHELKTPLSIILGAVQLMDLNLGKESIDYTKIGNYSKTVRQNCYRLLRLTKNMLDISKLDAGYQCINASSCNIVCLAEEIFQSVLPYAAQKGLELEFDTEAEEIFTAVDIDKMERIILNLLSNAIKFTAPGGKISVIVQRIDNIVHISVKDNGPGIPQNMQSAIFERFRQAGASVYDRSAGAGIGLSLVKYFVQLHKGSIKVMSELGKGSEFIVELPIVPADNKISGSQSVCSASRNDSRIIDTVKIELSDIYSFAS